MINVLFFEPYPMGLGGNYKTQRLILERLDKREFRPIVVAPIEGAALKRFREFGVQCIVISPPGDLDRYGGFFLGGGIIRKIKVSYALLCYNIKIYRFLRDSEIDIVITNCVRAQMCVGLAAKLANVPSVLYIKGRLANAFIDHICFVMASKILFQCSQNRDDKYPLMVWLFGKKIVIIGSGVDSSSISHAEMSGHMNLIRELAVDKQWVNAAVIGQLYRPKGVHFAIEALAKVVHHYPRVRLYVVGDHVIEEYRSYKEEIDALIVDYGLAKHVHFTGWRDDALNIVSEMDVIIHPSLAEGFPRAVLEAMALGKPVIASKVGGLREAITDGVNGFLVEPGDVDAIANRWRRLIVDRELRVRMGQAAREKVFSEYLIDDKVVKLAEIWKEMAKYRRQRGRHTNTNEGWRLS